MAEKKTLYHSELVQMGRVQVTQKDLPRASKFKDKNDYVVLEIDGVERIYNCENDDCQAFFNVQGNQGRCMVIEAQGTRENAQIDWIEDVDAAPERSAPPARKAAPAARQAPAPAPARAAAPAPRPAPAPAPQAPPPPPPPAPAAAKPPARKGPTKEEQQAKVGQVRVLAAKLSNVCQISRTAAEHARDMFKAQRDTVITEEQVQSWAASIFIQIVRDGHHLDMPASPIGIGTPPASIPGEPDPGEQGVEGEDDVPM